MCYSQLRTSIQPTKFPHKSAMNGTAWKLIMKSAQTKSDKTSSLLPWCRLDSSSVAAVPATLAWSSACSCDRRPRRRSRRRPRWRGGSRRSPCRSLQTRRWSRPLKSPSKEPPGAGKINFMSHNNLFKQTWYENTRIDLFLLWGTHYGVKWGNIKNTLTNKSSLNKWPHFLISQNVCSPNWHNAQKEPFHPVDRDQ